MRSRTHITLGCCGNGFTLIEAIVVGAVWAVLLAVSLPVLQNVRSEAEVSTCLSNLRESGRAFLSHATSRNDVPPHAERYARSPAERPNDARGLIRSRGAFVLDVNYFLDYAWSVPVQIADGEADEACICPSYSTEDREGQRLTGDGLAIRPLLSTYRVAHGFYASPRYWQGGAQQSPRDLAPQPLTAVAFPSSKAAIVETDARHFQYGAAMTIRARQVHTPAVFADGAARLVSSTVFRSGVPNALALYARHPLITTEHGILGYDR